MIEASAVWFVRWRHRRR